MDNPYARLVSWEVWNFMSFKHAKVEFDDKNILNFKGYNDSGKSAMLTALKVLMTNANPQKQVSFIKDDEDYFRIMAYFEDGVIILRDKYLNGQSLYEMYKDKELLFSTKVNGALTRVSDVPEPIQEYLGLISYDATHLNFRACFETKIGVETSGSENYKMFNTVLRSEEIARASELLNNDRNRLGQDINTVSSQLDLLKEDYKPGITGGIVTGLRLVDSELDELEGRFAGVVDIIGRQAALDGIKVPPELEPVDTQRFNLLADISDIIKALDEVNVPPAVEMVDSTRYTAVLGISDLFEALDGISVPPEIEALDGSRLTEVETVATLLGQMLACKEQISNCEEQVKTLNYELDTAVRELEDYGVSFVRCPDCGKVFNPAEAHVH